MRSYQDKYKALKGYVKKALGLMYGDFYAGYRKQGIKGDVFFRLDHADGSVEEHSVHNVVTRDLSVLLARLALNPLEPRHGIFALAIGSGDVGWDLQNPPAETNTQRALYSEISRKTFSDVTFVDASGSPVTRPTNVVDYTTTFAQTEAVGPLVEMGLVGGDVSEDLNIRKPVTPSNGPYDVTVDQKGLDTLCNYLTFPVINKPATSRLTIVWRLTF